MASIAPEIRFWNKAARKYAASAIADVEGCERTLDRTRYFLRPSDTVFEFGCGTGTTALRLAPAVAQLIATDISQEMVTIAREKAGAETCENLAFAVAEPGSLPVGEEKFDVVLAFNVLHLMTDRAAALTNVRRILKPGGYFISKTVCLSELNPLAAGGLRIAIPIMRMLGKAPPVAFISARHVEDEIVAAGFTIVERGYHASKAKDIRPFFVAQKDAS